MAGGIARHGGQAMIERTGPIFRREMGVEIHHGDQDGQPLAPAAVAIFGAKEQAGAEGLHRVAGPAIIAAVEQGHHCLADD